MTQTLTAIFDGRVLRPDRPLDLKPNTRYVVTVQIPATSTAVGDAWDVLDQAAGSVEAPADWAKEHGHYLDGEPRRSTSRSRSA